MKIINIRGSHGSGKSWVVRQIMTALPAPEIELRADGKKIEGYLWREPTPLFVVGKYIDGISTGGCDTFKDINDIEEIVLRRAAGGLNVLFEGIRVNNHQHSRVAWFRHNKQHDWYFLILNTTVEQSLVNIARRREAAGLAPAGPSVAESVLDHWKRCQRQREHFRRAGLNMEYLSAEAAVGRTRELLA